MGILFLYAYEAILQNMFRVYQNIFLKTNEDLKKKIHAPCGHHGEN